MLVSFLAWLFRLIVVVLISAKLLVEKLSALHQSRLGRLSLK